MLPRAMHRVLVLVAVSWFGCFGEPYVSGSKEVTVGQKLEIEVAQGPVFASGQVSFTDSDGNQYGPGDLEYEFLDDHHVRLRIPPGAATGPARLHLGAVDRPEGYDLDFHVHRMAVLLDPNGSLYCVDTDTGHVVDIEVLGHGEVFEGLLDRGAKVLATTSKESSVHFFRVTGDGLERYSPAVDGVGSSARGAVRFGRRTFVAVEEGLAVLEEGADGSTVLTQVLDGLTGPAWDIQAAWDAGRAALLVGFSQDATQFEERVALLEAPEGADPVLHAPGVLLEGTVGGWTSLAIAPDGAVAWVSNRVDDTVAVVRLGPPAQVAQVVDLPAEGQDACRDPFRVVADPYGRFLAVLCVETKSLALYGIGADGQLTGPTVARLEDVPWDASFTRDWLYVLASWEVLRLELGGTELKPEDAGWDVGVGMSRLVVQP